MIVQTFFCCLYFQDLERYIKPIPVFGAFADAFLVACRKARNAILRAGVFDDEDFLPNLFGLDLGASVFSADPAKVRSRADRERITLAGMKGGRGEAAALRMELIAEYSSALVELEQT